MKVTLRETVTREVKYLHLVVGVNYGEEDIPNDIYGRNGDTLTWTIDIDANRIQGYSHPSPVSLYMKVCDNGSYYLLDAEERAVAEIESDYVPGGMGEYGDYLKFDIAPDGAVSGIDWEDVLEHFKRKNDDD